jgi:hypothetical protein
MESNGAPSLHNNFTVSSSFLENMHTLEEDAALLHILATHPDRIIPAGKSLRSGLLRPERVVSSNASSLEARVSGAMHKAFWSEVRYEELLLLR